jgi:hypothetical protein
MRVSSRAPVAETLTKSWIVGAGQKQRRVQDGYPVAEPLGFLQPVGGEEDGHAALSEVMSSCTSRAATGSSPEVGSSRNSTAGSFSSARASATR